MSTKRTLRKNIDKYEKTKQPAILIVPDETFDPEDKDLITITDSKIYTRLLEGAEWALENKRTGVTRTPKLEEEND